MSSGICDTCIEYIKKMKQLEFRISDYDKEKEIYSEAIDELKQVQYSKVTLIRFKNYRMKRSGN